MFRSKVNHRESHSGGFCSTACSFISAWAGIIKHIHWTVRRTHMACLSISEGTGANLSLMKRGSQRAFEVAKPARHSANTLLYELYEVDLSRASLLSDEENSLKAHDGNTSVECIWVLARGWRERRNEWKRERKDLMQKWKGRREKQPNNAWTHQQHWWTVWISRQVFRVSVQYEDRPISLNTTNKIYKTIICVSWKRCVMKVMNNSIYFAKYMR